MKSKKEEIIDAIVNIPLTEWEEYSSLEYRTYIKNTEIKLYWSISRDTALLKFNNSKFRHTNKRINKLHDRICKHFIRAEKDAEKAEWEKVYSTIFNPSPPVQ